MYEVLPEKWTEQIYYRGDTSEHDMDKPERGFQLPKRAL